MLINHVPCYHHSFSRWSLEGDWCRSNQMTRLEQSEHSLTDGKKYLQYFIFSPKLRKLFFKLILSRLLNRVALTELPFNSISGNEMEI